MNDEFDAILRFLKVSERLKDTLRTSYTSDGRQESVAEHTWRLALLAISLAPKYREINILRLLKIIIVHDLGEIINGDIPAIDQTSNAEKNVEERKDYLQVIEALPDDLRSEFLDLWDEYNAAQTKEARLAKALDKLETVLQHTQGKNPEDFDYAFNLEYGKQHTDFDEITKGLREIIDGWTAARAK